ncbi:hypothetical protein LWI29_015885 [Acer saccharum]|uniref:Uncharacterized protein n=1 Tax=Acer saccharum TaxID=4024 RepID=A0AA39STT5_ACESA|nr:hypothetical protein LWI29_015885 [Acer saccharum]
MDRHLSHSFQIPPASLSIFGTITMLTGLVLYERLFVPLARRFTKNPSGITCLQRMGIGFTINIFATLVSSFFCIHGVAEVFMSVGHLEFLYDQSPESMRSSAAALYWVAISIGNYIGTLMVTLVHKYTGKEHIGCLIGT